MTRNKYSAIYVVGLLVILFIPQGTKAEIEGSVIKKEKSVVQNTDESQMLNNETSAKYFGIKLFGNFGKFVGQNDVNKQLDGWNQLLNESAKRSGFGVSGEISPLGYSPSFGGELIFSFLPRLAIGLGAEYLRFTEPSTKKLTSEGGSLDITLEPKISAVPITLSLYYNLPIGGFLKVVAGVGAGYYLGKYSNSLHQTRGDEQITLLYESNKNTIGAHANLNFELNIGRTMALVFGVSGRFAVLKNLLGKDTLTYTVPAYSESGSIYDQPLWYIEEEWFEGLYYADLKAMEEKPVASYYRNVRKAEISLSSMALQIGILIKLSQLFK